MSHTKFKQLIVIVFSVLLSLNLSAETKLHLSHQWPSTTDDLRHNLALYIQQELKKADIGVSLKITAKEKLKIKPWLQWSAMTSNHIDMTIFPLAYAGPKYPHFNITLMPGIIKNHEHAKRFSKSKVMQVIKKIMEDAGVLVISDIWLAGGFVSNKKCISEPEDVKGLWMRAAGTMYNQMLAKAGANISSMPSSKIYSKMDNNELDGAITSSSSLVSYKIYKVAKCLISPADVAIWFMYEPILISKSSFNKLTQKQQQVLMDIGKKAENIAYIEAKKADKDLVEIYRKHGVTVKKLSLKQFKKWQDVAKKSSYEQFEDEVQYGEKLLSWALEIK